MSRNWLIDTLIDYNWTSTRQWLFYANRTGNQVYCMFMYTLFEELFLMFLEEFAQGTMEF